MSRLVRILAAPTALIALAVANPSNPGGSSFGFIGSAQAEESCARSAASTSCAPSSATRLSGAVSDDGRVEDDPSERRDSENDRCAAGASTAGSRAADSEGHDSESSDCRLVGESEDDADWDGLRMASGRPVNGWWWDPAQSGRGYSIEIHDGRLFLGAFLYGQDGRAMWVVSTGRMSDPFHYTGQLMLHGGGPTLAESQRSPQALGDLGTIRLTFTGPGAGSLTMPDGSVVTLERFSVVAGGAAQSWDGHDDGHPTTGWYWNPAQGGRGFFAEVQGDRLFVVAFMYRSDGSAVWYAANQGLTSGGAFQRTFTGALYEYQSAPGLETSVEPSQQIGTATVQFRRGGRAAVTMPTGEVIAVQRFRF